jgi:hypothetical protein
MNRTLSKAAARARVQAEVRHRLQGRAVRPRPPAPGGFAPCRDFPANLLTIAGVTIHRNEIQAAIRS